MRLPLNNIFRGTYYPLNKINISPTNLLKNYRYLSSLKTKVKILPVLKSNAYGHGIVEVAKILDKIEPAMICVDSLYEAYELKKAKIKAPILMMGYVNPHNLKVKKLPFSYAAYDLALLESVNRFQKGAEVHIKVDTGMNRLGVPVNELRSFLKSAKKFKNIKIAGLMSHLASSDNPSDTQNRQQLENFKKARKIFSDENISPKWIHLSATDGLLNLRPKIEKITNAARVGLGLYGIHKSDKRLKPVLKLTSQIVQIKEIKKGDRVGYSGTFKAKENMKIGLLPIGYNDGFDRRLSNTGVVKIGNQYCPIVGRISMNISAVDVSKVENPRVGDKALIYSDNVGDLNSIQNAADLCGTIPYELLIHLSPTSIKRIVS